MRLGPVFTNPVTYVQTKSDALCLFYMKTSQQPEGVLCHLCLEIHSLNLYFTYSSTWSGTLYTCGHDCVVK